MSERVSGLVEAAARAIHQRQEYSTCWDDEQEGSSSRMGTKMRPLGEHGREFYRGLVRATIPAIQAHVDAEVAAALEGARGADWARRFLEEWARPYFGDDARDAVAAVVRADERARMIREQIPTSGADA